MKSTSAPVKAVGYFTMPELVALARRESVPFDVLYGAKPEPVAAEVAGLAVLAADTGRVLMIQRAYDEGDPASGMFEFPGGHLEDGETPLDAAVREWEEETGLHLPDGKVVGEWKAGGGKYCGYAYQVRREEDLDILEGRDADANPDSDGDLIEAIAWMDCEHLSADNPVLRKEIRETLDVIAEAFPKSTKTRAAELAVYVVDVLTGGEYTPHQRAARAEFLRAARRKSNPRPGRQVISQEGADQYGLAIGMDILPGMRKLTVTQQGAVKAMRQSSPDGYARFVAARRSGATFTDAMKAAVAPGRKATPAKATKPDRPLRGSDLRDGDVLVWDPPEGDPMRGTVRIEQRGRVTRRFVDWESGRAEPVGPRAALEHVRREAAGSDAPSRPAATKAAAPAKKATVAKAGPAKAPRKSASPSPDVATVRETLMQRDPPGMYLANLGERLEMEVADWRRLARQLGVPGSARWTSATNAESAIIEHFYGLRRDRAESRIAAGMRFLGREADDNWLAAALRNNEGDPELLRRAADRMDTIPAAREGASDETVAWRQSRLRAVADHIEASESARPAVPAKVTKRAPAKATPRKPAAPLAVEDLRSDPSRVSELDAMKVADLKVLAEKLSIPKSQTKPKLLAAIRYQLGDRGAAPAKKAAAAPEPVKAAPAKSTPSAASRIDESVPLAGGPNRWDDNMRMHGDSLTMRLARAYADAGRNGSANRLIDLRRRATTPGTDGITPQQVVDELRAIRAEEPDPAFQRQLDRAIDGIDAPMTPLPDLPPDTPPLARDLIERLHAIPRARKSGNVDREGMSREEWLRMTQAGDGSVRGPSLVEQVAEVYRDAAAQRRGDDGRSPAERLRSILRDQVHEMDESAFRIWELERLLDTEDGPGGRRASALVAELRSWERGELPDPKAPAAQAAESAEARERLSGPGRGPRPRRAEDWGIAAPRVTPSPADVRTGWFGGSGRPGAVKRSAGGHGPEAPPRPGKTRIVSGWTREQYEAAVRSTIDTPQIAVLVPRGSGRMSVRYKEVDRVIWAVISDDHTGRGHAFRHAHPVNGDGVVLDTEEGSIPLPLDRSVLTTEYLLARYGGA